MFKQCLPAIVLLGFLTTVVRAETATSKPAGPATRPDHDGITVLLSPDDKFPTSPGYHVLGVQATTPTRKIQMRVGLFLPPTYFKSSDRFPMVVTLHNRGWEGDDSGIIGEGMASLWVRDHDDRNSLAQPAEKRLLVRKTARFVGVAPQLPMGFGFESDPMPQIISALIDVLADQYRIDQEREYLTGFSYGASCTWRIAEQLPDKFAAIIPISGRQTDNPKRTIEELKGVSIYLACGTNEWATSTCKIMGDALKAGNHPDYVYRIMDGGNHWSYPYIYEDPDFWQWLFARKRGSATTRPTTRPVQASTQAKSPNQ